MVQLTVGIPTESYKPMTDQTVKDQQVDTIFNPQNDNDKALVELYTGLSHLVEANKGNRAVGRLIATQCGIVKALGNVDLTTLDGEFVGEQVRTLLDEYIQSCTSE